MNRQLPAPGEPHYLIRTIDADIDEAQRAVTFVASDESIDRYGDIVRSDWQLKPFKKNPVFLWNHNYNVPPIGIVETIEVVGKKLMATTKFLAAGVSEYSDQLFRLVRANVLRAVSVGFTVEPDNIERMLNDEGNWTGGLIYHEPELLEISLVSVPANAKALAVARALGVPDPLVRSALLDAFVIEQQRDLNAKLTAARIRELKLYRPR
jgi:prohead serine protease